MLEVLGHRGERPSPLEALRATLEAERDRWFLWLPVIYGCGVALYFALLGEPSLLVVLAPVPLVLAIRLVLRSGTLTVMATGIALAFAVGFAAAKIRTMWVSAPILERQINVADVRGFVESVEPRAGRGQRLTLRVVSIRGLPPERLPYRVRVRTMATMPGLAPGDPVRIRATLGPPARPALPGDYDFARAAFFQRLGGVGYALTRPERDAEAGTAPPMLQIEAAVARVRQSISQRVRAALPGERGAIADALITGERGGISEATNNAYRDSGLFHILSISGLHMTIMAGAVFFAIRLLLASVPAIALRVATKKWAAAAATLAAFGYLLISGASFATVRAWVMISIMFLAVLLDRPAVALRNVALSALVIMAVLPESLFDLGFQMSFAAVVAIIAAYEALRERQRVRDREPRFGRVLIVALFFGGIILTTLIATVAVAPFAAYHFHKSQQYAVLANLIAIPVCNVLVMPAALVTLVAMPLGLEAAPLRLMGLGIDLMTWCAQTVARLPGAVGRLSAIPQAAFLAMVGGGLWLCLWRRRWRLLGLAGIAAGLGLAPTLRQPDVLVGLDGSLVAVRTASGVLSALAARGAGYELSRWLEHDGDPRSPREVARADAFRCDAVGCTATVRGIQLAVARHPAAVADDCARAGLLVLTMPRPRSCRGEGPVIDFIDMRRQGTHAIYLQPSLSIVTVAGVRGERPWTGRDRAPPLSPVTAVTRGSRLGQFAAPFDLSDQPDAPRLDLDEDEADLRMERGPL